MYSQNVSVLVTEAREVGGHHTLHKLVSNRNHIRDPHGNKVGRRMARNITSHTLLYNLEQGIGDSITSVQGHISDKVLSERIRMYLDNYYAKYVTNCSTFAHYLKTGMFIECAGSRHFIFEGSMTTYTGQRIKVGDTLCLFYYSKVYHSRRVSKQHRQLYRRNKKLQSEGNSFLEIGKREKHSVWSTEELADMYQNSGMSDYHFMTCVAHKNGVPVFIHQNGGFGPKSSTIAPLVCTLGGFDPYPEKKKPPYAIFIQKRHTK